jgi:hypothetical protein
MMNGLPDASKPPSDVDLRDLQDVEARVSRLAERFSQRDPRIAAALTHEAQVLRDLMGSQPPPVASAHGSLHRLRELVGSAVTGGLYEEAKDASLLMLLNRLLGI